MFNLKQNYKDKQTVDILQSVYRNACLAHKATIDVLGRCRNNDLYGELAKEQDRYKAVSLRARRELANRGLAAYEAPAYVRAMVKTGIAMKTATDNSTSRLAEIMYRGTTMGITDMQRTLNRSRAADGDIRARAEKLLEREQQFCDDLKRCL